jgi:hypothetical protein
MLASCRQLRSARGKFTRVGIVTAELNTPELELPHKPVPERWVIGMVVNLKNALEEARASVGAFMEGEGSKPWIPLDRVLEKS